MTENLVHKLISLAQLDCDATSVYDEALKHVKDEGTRAQFVEFRDEHQGHLTELSAVIERLDGTKPDLGVDLMGHVADLFTSLRSMGGDQGALHSMRTAEKYHVQRYTEAATWQTDDPALDQQLGRFLAEEMRHLSYMETKLGETVASPR